MLTEISLNVIDIARNSIRAGASLIQITVRIDDQKKTLRLTIADNGSGMNHQQLSKVEDPFLPPELPAGLAWECHSSSRKPNALAELLIYGQKRERAL